MKYRIIFLLCLSALVSLQTFAQPALQWDKRFNGSIGNDQGNAIAVDASGNVYVAASSDGSNFMSDYLIVKYNSLGDTVWSRRYNGSANGIDAAVAIRVDVSGNVYVTGHSQSTGLGYDIVTLKYNAQGILQWAKVFDGGNNGANKDDMGYNLEVDIAGNVYVVGSSYPIGGNYADGVVIKYNPMGTLLWKININESANYPEVTNLITINNIGNVVVTEGVSTVEGAYVIFELNPANGAVVKEYNIYTFPPGLFPVIGFPNDIVLDDNNNMYVVSSANQLGSGLFEVHTAKFSYGMSTRSWDSYNQVSGSSNITGVGIDIDLALNTYVLSDFYNGISHYIRLRKYNASGATQWVKTFAAVPNVDNIPLSLSLGNEVINPSILVAGNIANGNINIVKFNNSGDTLWQRVYDCGTNGLDVASMMITDNCDNIYITGNSNCNGTNKDVKTIKYSTNTPTITINKPTPIICQGDSLILQSSSANAYLWNTGATTQSITVSTSGNYSVTITDINLCTGASAATTVTVLPAPTATVTPPGPVFLCEGSSVLLTASTASSYLWSNGATAQSIPVSTTGMYSVTVTGANNCTAASPATSVVVNPLPEAIIIANDTTTFCEGGSVTLTSNEATSYKWNNGATTQSITVSTSGNYSVTITDDKGCQNASPPTVVTVYPLPVVDLGNSITLTQGDSAILNAGQWSAYEWSTNETTPTITISSMGTYSVTVTNSFNCTAVDSIVVTVTSSTKDFQSRYKITVFPNPTQQAINIKREGGFTTSVQVFDNFGKLILGDNTFVTDSSIRTLLLDKLPSGNYYLKIVGEGFEKIVPIIKQ